ncbi:hypothetical protein C789_4567 [Microcystis aeruginosa FACHB-905 = DIANCHI905]|uniref:Uncharacterized protein n=1 Tax=Microcystis aeruginosa PCC 7806SL TaxID=1903187 RepID=A0AB33BXZ9_MICA7|nr:hypothetical protein BH695_2051 [Microcystis aeruginosa PCC 7806SL]ELS45575.1 hypothetical protein C789_4567 [Microcystis aeruginosa FACHB-905 = DIANCHI905]
MLLLVYGSNARLPFQTIKSHIPHPQLSQIKKAIKVVHNN